jgi:hypothetical protein
MLADSKIMRFYRLGIFTALPTLLTAVMASVALASVAPATYTPTATSFNPANAPASSHLTSGMVDCVVNQDESIDCSTYVLGGVGHTNATVNLQAAYSATIDCTNHGGSLVESHTTTFSDTSTATVSPTRNGQLTVAARSVSPFSAPQVCPNPNWTPSIRGGTVTLMHFTYTLTFQGFDQPYITITATDP